MPGKLLRKIVFAMVFGLLFQALCLQAQALTDADHKQIAVYMRDGSVIVTDDLVDLYKKRAVQGLDPYVRIKKLNIGGIELLRQTDRYKYDFDEINQHIGTLILLDPYLAPYKNGEATIITKNGEQYHASETTLVEYLGHRQPWSYINVMVYDAYNNDWFEKEISIKKIKQIVFETHSQTATAVFASDKTAIKAELDAKKPQKKERTVNLKIGFDNNSYAIQKASHKTLYDLGNVLMEIQGKGKTLRINGHTDARGTAAYNMTLSRQRAKAVKKWLADRYDLSKFSIETQGYGESRPVASNQTKSGRQLNRRVEITVVD